MRAAQNRGGREISKAIRGLLFTVFFGMRLAGVIGVIASVGGVAAGRMSMMRCFLMLSALVMLSRFAVMTSSFRVMFGSFAMMFSSFFRHRWSSGDAHILRMEMRRAPG